MTNQAFDIYDPLTYPTRRDEDWRFSDLGRYLKTDVEKSVRDWPDYEKDTITHNIVGRKLTRPAYQNHQSLAIAPGVQRVVVERYSGDKLYASQETFDISLGEGSGLLRLVFLEEDEGAATVRLSRIGLAPNSVFRQFVFTKGSGFQRFETHVSHCGQGAHLELHGAYLLKGKAHTDLTSVVTHYGIGGTTSQTLRGLVKDQALSVFQGRISVQKGADKTDARMHHGAIILNDSAKVRAKPELEIFADDVSCAHGNTVGALDEEALFYCQSRGLDERSSRALLTRAYLIPVIELIEDEDLRSIAEQWLETTSGGFYDA